MRHIHLLLLIGASHHKRMGWVQLLAGYAETNDQDEAEHEVELVQNMIVISGYFFFFFIFWKFFSHLIATLLVPPIYPHKHKNDVPWLLLPDFAPMFSSMILTGFYWKS